MEKPIEILKEEHRIIKNALDILEIFCNAKLESISSSNLNELLMFFSEFADKCHHAKEEDLLFPLIEKRGVPKESGPIGVMLLEHERLRELRRLMLKLSKNINKNSNKFKKTAREFIDLLRNHIEKEDNILYPMSEQVLSELDNKKLLNDFEKVEGRTGKDIHKKYIKLIEQLAKNKM